jgi:cytochrome c biogenesis protein ResB
MADGSTRGAQVRLNQPLQVQGLSLGQASYDAGEDASPAEAGRTLSTLSVHRKPGLPLVYAGFVGLVAGVLISVCLQPLLRRKRPFPTSRKRRSKEGGDA